MTHRRILLLTATVTPHPQMTALAMRAPDERFQQYYDAFAFLVSSGATAPFDRIIVCENSGFPLERFDSAFAGSDAEITYISVEMDESAGKFGRGYSEMLLMDSALREAAHLIDDDDRVWKLTGRYRVENLSKVVTKSDASADVVVTLRRYPSKWADLYLFAFNRKAWNEIAARLDSLRAMSGSVAMYDIIDELGSRGLKVKARLGSEPRLAGIRGHDRRRYDSGRQRLKRHTRQLLHLIAPRLRV